jgi:hypothetical protein
LSAWALSASVYAPPPARAMHLSSSRASLSTLNPIAWMRISTPPLAMRSATVHGDGGWQVSLPSETRMIVRGPVVPRSSAARSRA